jgi:hypothetical protein
MTQDEIIELANKAGIIHPQRIVETLEVFAKLVAEHEREECAKICDDWANGWSSEPEMAEMAAEIRARGKQ